MSNIERKYAYYDEGVLPEEGEYGITYLTLYSSNAGNIYDGWLWDPEHKTEESLTERTFGYRNPDYPDYCWDDEVVVDLSNAQNRQESSEFAQGRITSFNTNVSSSPIILEDVDITGLTEEERENKATVVLFSAIPLVDDSYIQAQIEVQCKVNLSPDNTSGEVRVEAFYILNDESDRTMRPNPVHTFTVSEANERHTLPWLYWNPALKHDDHNYIGVKLLATGGTVEIGISDDPDYGDAIITLVSAGLTGDNIFGGKPVSLEIFGKEDVIGGYKLNLDDYTVLCTYDTGEIYDVTHMCEYTPEMGTEIIDPITILTAYYQGLSASMSIRLGMVQYIELTGPEIFHGSLELSMDDYTVLAYLDNGDIYDVTKECAYEPNMGTVITEDTTLTAYYCPWWMNSYISRDTIGQYGQGNIDLYNRPMYIQPEDGSVSTVNSMSFSEDEKEILIPTIGRDEKGNPIQMDFREAVDYYYQTGEYLGKFDTIEEADEYAEALHEQQEMIYDLENAFSDSLDIEGDGVYLRYGGSGNQGLIYTQYDDGYMDITGSVLPYESVEVKPLNKAAQTGEQITIQGTITCNVTTAITELDVYRDGTHYIFPNSSYYQTGNYDPNLFINIPKGPRWKKITTLEWKASGQPLGMRFKDGKTIDDFKGFDKIDTSNLFILDEAFYEFDYSESDHDPINKLLSSMDLSNVVSLHRTFMKTKFHEEIEGIKINSYEIANMTECFRNSNFIPKLNIKTPKLKFISSAFLACLGLTDCENIKNLDVHNVIDMGNIFTSCSSLKDISGLRKWDVKNVRSMYAAFCMTAIESVESLSSWKNANIFNAEYLFARCSRLKSLSGINPLLSNLRVATSEDNAIYDATSLIPKTDQGTYMGSMRDAFIYETDLEDASGLGTLIFVGTIMPSRFRWCSNLKKVGFVLINPYSLYDMFDNCPNLRNIDSLANWNVGSCINIDYLLNGCSAINKGYARIVAGWNTRNVKSMDHAFYYTWASDPDEHGNHNLDEDALALLNNWDVTSLTNDYYAFSQGSTAHYTPPITYTLPDDPHTTRTAVPWWQNKRTRT